MKILAGMSGAQMRMRGGTPDKHQTKDRASHTTPDRVYMVGEGEVDTPVHKMEELDGDKEVIDHIHIPTMKATEVDLQAYPGWTQQRSAPG